MYLPESPGEFLSLPNDTGGAYEHGPDARGPDTGDPDTGVVFPEPLFREPNVKVDRIDQLGADEFDHDH